MASMYAITNTLKASTASCRTSIMRPRPSAARSDFERQCLDGALAGEEVGYESWRTPRSSARPGSPSARSASAARARTHHARRRRGSRERPRCDGHAARPERGPMRAHRRRRVTESAHEHARGRGAGPAAQARGTHGAPPLVAAREQLHERRSARVAGEAEGLREPGANLRTRLAKRSEQRSRGRLAREALDHPLGLDVALGAGRAGAPTPPPPTRSRRAPALRPRERRDPCRASAERPSARPPRDRGGPRGESLVCGWRGCGARHADPSASCSPALRSARSNGSRRASRGGRRPLTSRASRSAGPSAARRGGPGASGACAVGHGASAERRHPAHATAARTALRGAADEPFGQHEDNQASEQAERRQRE